MNFDELKNTLDRHRQQGKKMFTTSSFQTHSLVLLHMLSRIDPDIPVVFINTGYHFPETISFRDKVIREFGLTRLVDLRPEIPKNLQRGADGRLLFASDPDYCCYLNKTGPLNNLLRSYDIWINGVRADQSTVRSGFAIEEQAPYNTLRLHPMLDWDNRMVYEYRRKYDLPEHPLDAQGYMSIGCEPCTRKFEPGMTGREARWFGLNKSECGLHTDLINTHSHMD